MTRIQRRFKAVAAQSQPKLHKASQGLDIYAQRRRKPAK
jgi:hypothetical protein